MNNDVKVEKKKRRGCSKVALLLAGGIVLACIFIFAIAELAPGPSISENMTAQAAAPNPTSVPAAEVDIPEDRATPIPTASLAPTNTPEPDGRSRQSPSLPGSAVGVDGMELSVDHIKFPTDQELDQANRFNPSAEDGKRLLMIYVSLSCVKDTSETCSVSRGDFEAFGSAGIVYQPIYNIVGIPDELDDLEFFGGASAVKWVAFEVGADETDFVLAYEPFLGLEQAYLRLPDEEAAEADG